MKAFTSTRVCTSQRAGTQSLGLATPSGPARQYAVTAARATPGQTPAEASRRQLLSLALVAPLLAQRPAQAEELATATSSSSGSNISASSAPTGSTAPQLLPLDAGTPFLDEDFLFVPPAQFNFVETNPLLTLETAQGPAKERSPVRARFDSPEGPIATVSVIVRGASSIKQTLLQVNDITAFGSPSEIAQLILPRGCTILGYTTLQVPVPPRTTQLGVVEFPPRTYYTYEFTVPNGLHVAMTVAARSGKIYVCGGSAPRDKWATYGPGLLQSVKSFRIRDKEVVVP